ncbi:molybdopterin-dependent oxidoreductase [Natrinema halophilum]|nr:molybdopterin-dependent oxidoreductase [Natrinema halophilum]
MRCAVGCGHIHRGADIGVGVDTVRGDPAHPVTEGLACARGLRETKDPGGEWLTRPLVRDGGELVRTTWDVALARATQGLCIAHDRTPDAVAILGSGQQTNEAAYALGKLARGGFGTRHYDANTSLCMASAVTAYYQAFGSDAPPCTYADIPDADRHVIWGANPAVAHPVLFRWIQQAADENGVEIVVVDPVRSETASNATHHVAPDPGKDLALARAVLAHLVATNRVDHSFVDRATDGFETLYPSLPSPAAAATAAGVGMESIELLAAALDLDALIYWGMGVNQHVQGTETARALIDLCLASGNLRPGTGPFSLTGQANSMGTRICSSKGTWPGQRPFADPDHRRVVADHWGVPVDRLPDDPGPGPVGLLESDPVEAIWTVATNPAAGMPDADRARETLADAFLVAQDAFRTETTALADVVLPAATWGESAGTTTNMERMISRIRPATEPPSGVRSDLEIIQTIGSRLFPSLFPDASPDPAAVFAEFTALTAGTVADCSGITYERLAESHAVRWPAPDTETAGGYRYYDDESWSFPTASGRAQFSTGRQDPLPEPTDDDYPLTLTTARAGDEYNTGVRSRVGTRAPVVRLHPDTVCDHRDHVVDDRIAIETRRGSVTARIDPDDGVPAGLVWLPIHHPAINRLTLSDRDPQSKEPHFKQCAVRLTAPADQPQSKHENSSSEL